MKLTDLLRHVTTPIFFDYQVERLFPSASKHQVNVQLARFVRAGALVRLKRGLYAFSHVQIDEFVLANWLYRPSYVSLESALNSYGIIPDIVPNVTSISPTTSKTITTSRGIFLYSKINPTLFFGYRSLTDPTSGLAYFMAEPEKALLDYIYIRQISELAAARVETESLDQNKLRALAGLFPARVRRVVNE